MVTDLLLNYQAGFAASIRRRARAISSWLCIGLDPDVDGLPSKIPPSAEGFVEFCREIVTGTSDYAVAYKVNTAFFEALGPDGWRAIDSVRQQIPGDIPVIGDAKRGDVPNTARMYARALFDELQFDAVTANPYLGWDSLQPFLDYENKGVFVLCKTSNPGASHFQDMDVGGVPLYLRIAREAIESQTAADVGLVVGATQPEALARVREMSDEVVILAPGVGAQGASASDAVRSGGNRRGENLLATASREIIHASQGSDFAEKARLVAKQRAEETWTGILDK